MNTQNLTPEHWSQVAKEPARPNTEAERMELVRDRDWKVWELHYRWHRDTKLFTQLEHPNNPQSYSFSSLQYILVPKEKKLREFWYSTALRAIFEQAEKPLGTPLHLIEFPEGWNPPSPPDSKVLTGEQVTRLGFLINDVADECADDLRDEALEILK